MYSISNKNIENENSEDLSIRLSELASKILENIDNIFEGKVF